MPRIQLKLTGNLTPWTKAPNIVIDKLMPMLKDSELRILLILIRSTIGWDRADSPVYLTYKMLEARSGRSSEAISKALVALERQGLIHIAKTRTRNYIRNAKNVSS